MRFFLPLIDHNGEDGEGEGEGIVLQPRYPWEGSDRDYKYEEVDLFYFSPYSVNKVSLNL